MTSEVPKRSSFDAFNNIEIPNDLLAFCSLSDLGNVAGTSKRFYGVVKKIISESILPDLRKFSSLISERVTDLGSNSLSDYDKHIEALLSNNERLNLGTVIDIKSQFIRVLASEPQPSNLSQVVTAPAHFSEVFTKTEEYIESRKSFYPESYFLESSPMTILLLFCERALEWKDVGNLMEKKLFCYRILEELSQTRDQKTRDEIFKNIVGRMCESENLYGALELANSISLPDLKVEAFLRIAKKMFQVGAEDSAMKAVDLAVEVALAVDDPLAKSVLLCEVLVGMKPLDMKIAWPKTFQKIHEVLSQEL